MRRTLRSAFLALVLAGCGGGDGGDADADPVDSAGSDAPSSSSCEGYALEDACMNEDNLAQCQQMAARCPGEVRVLESCPLQFACP